MRHWKNLYRSKVSPLSQGRELKLIIRKLVSLIIKSPLSQGRELKYRAS